jgi:5,5'-dehydrodivanillate O-demethylase
MANGEVVTDKDVRTVTNGDPVDFVHTGPGTLAGRYMRMFWQPVYRAEDLALGRAVPLKVMGEDFTLYRGEGGTPHLLEFRCAHRGAQLSIGKVEGDNLRCLYHGWKYDGEGRCVEQPAEVRPFCERIKLRGYPVVEYLGLIFAYLGEGEPPPRPLYQEFEREGVLLAIPPYVVPCNYFNQIDNNGDMHVHFVHPTTIEGVIMAERTMEETEFGFTWYEGFNTAKRTYHFIMPNLIKSKRFALSRSVKEWTEVLSWTIPIDDERHHRFELYLEHVTGEEARQYRESQSAWFKKRSTIPELGDQVLSGRLQLAELRDGSRNMIQIEDYIVLAAQGAIPDREREHLGSSDAVVIFRRQLWERELRALAQGKPIKRQPQWLEGGPK